MSDTTTRTAASKTTPAAGMPGMASHNELTRLARVDGRAFERRFLTLMIEHHRGAITMAEEHLDEAHNRAAQALADTIANSQRSEIERMEKLLAELPASSRGDAVAPSRHG